MTLLHDWGAAQSENPDGVNVRTMAELAAPSVQPFCTSYPTGVQSSSQSFVPGAEEGKGVESQISYY